jgi:hypothetical protein
MVDSRPVRLALGLGQHERESLDALLGRVDRLDALLGLDARTEDERKEAVGLVEMLHEMTVGSGTPSIRFWYAAARSALGNPVRYQL